MSAASLVFLDEMIPLVRNDMNTLKSWVTGDCQTVVAKGKDAVQGYNSVNFVATGNDPNKIPMEPGCRRFITAHITCTPKEKEWYDRLYDAAATPEFKRAMLDWLNEVDMSVPIKSLIPEAIMEDKKALIANDATTDDEILRDIYEYALASCNGDINKLASNEVFLKGIEYNRLLEIFHSCDAYTLVPDRDRSNGYDKKIKKKWQASGILAEPTRPRNSITGKRATWYRFNLDKVTYILNKRFPNMG